MDLDITPRDRDAKDLLVECTCEVTVQILVVVDGLRHHLPAEPEVVEVVLRVDVALGVRLVRLRPHIGLLEERVVGIHHGVGQLVEPLAHETTGINALLSSENDVDLALELVALTTMQRIVRVLKDVLAVHESERQRIKRKDANMRNEKHNVKIKKKKNP